MTEPLTICRHCNHVDDAHDPDGWCHATVFEYDELGAIIYTWNCQCIKGPGSD